MRFRICIIGIVLLCSCSKKDANSSVLLLSHAGDGLSMPNAPYPANSTAAVNYALEMGADGVEVDIQLSKDGQWILFHDVYLDGKTTRKGCVAEYSSDEIVQTFFQAFPNRHIDLLKDLEVGTKTLVLDIRHYEPCSNTIHTLNELLPPLLEYASSHSSTPILYNSNYPTLLDTLRKLGKTVSYNAVSWKDIQSVSTSQYPIYVVRNEAMTAAQVSEIQEKGAKVILFDVRSQSGNKKALAKHPDYLMTDNLSGAIQLK